MTNNIDELFVQMKINKSTGFDSLVNEINTNNINISKSPPLSLINNDLQELYGKLPPSFVKFINEVANGLHIEIGNALTILPVGQSIKNDCANVMSLTNEILSDSLFPSNDFIFFAMSGVDSNKFAFYTATKLNNNEFPIVWFTPASIDNKHFVLVNSSFDKFITIQYYMLKATDYEETFETIEAAVLASSNKNQMEQDEENWQNFQNKLYETFDPIIPKPNENYYKSVMNISELKRVIEETLKDNIMQNN